MGFIVRLVLICLFNEPIHSVTHSVSMFSSIQLVIATSFSLLGMVGSWIRPMRRRSLVRANQSRTAPQTLRRDREVMPNAANENRGSSIQTRVLHICVSFLSCAVYCLVCINSDSIPWSGHLGQNSIWAINRPLFRNIGISNSIT